MPKFYKVINIKRQHMGAYVLPEVGYKTTMESKSLAPDIKLLGECDAAGNILHEIASANFMSKKPNTKTIDVIGEIIKRDETAFTKNLGDKDPDFDGPLDPMFGKDTPIDPELLSESNGPALQKFDENKPTINEKGTDTRKPESRKSTGEKPKTGTGKKSGAKK